MYTDSRADYLLTTKNTPLVVSNSTYIWRSLRFHKNIGFLIPKEGSFITIENIAIPSKSKKNDLIYIFLNYIYKKESMQYNFLERAVFPATVDALKDLNLDSFIKELINIDEKKIKHFHFFHTTIPPMFINDIWIAVKSA